MSVPSLSQPVVERGLDEQQGWTLPLALPLVASPASFCGLRSIPCSFRIMRYDMIAQTATQVSAVSLFSILDFVINDPFHLHVS